MLSEIKNYRALKKFSFSCGADLFGVADLSDWKKNFAFSAEVARKSKRAVSLGVKLSSFVLSEIEAEPTKLYFHHYKTANMFLDQLAFRVAHWIEQRGFSALAVPASQITDWGSQKGHLSHREVGRQAGLGWIGRNNLLVSEKFGAQFRMATVLTEMPLKADGPLAKGCGACVRCLEACPAGAIRENPADFDSTACFEKLKEFQKKNIVGQYICGVCVKACSKGR